MLIRLARSVYFPERTYLTAMRMAENHVPGVELDRLRLWLQDRCPDLKAEDALRLLRLARRMSKSDEQVNVNAAETATLSNQGDADEPSC